MSNIVFLYVTAPDAETARVIANKLVAEKLAACVNIHAEMRSLYEWEGKIETAVETPMLVKTARSAAAAASDLITALHPYETPCIAALPVAAEGSNAGFLDWVLANSNPAP